MLRECAMTNVREQSRLKTSLASKGRDAQVCVGFIREASDVGKFSFI